jgi:geranylgeranyl pyrophosphate synthase
MHVPPRSTHHPGRMPADEHGRSVAILLGDVLLAAAGGPLLTCRVPRWRSRGHAAFVRLQVEVMAGQFLDADAAARRSADLARALTSRR